MFFRSKKKESGVNDLSETRRRKRERITSALILVLLLVFTAVEVHLLRLSAKLPFVNSIFFFGLMNLNIILIMLLLFLVFRNAVKLILDERRGKPGSRLKTRLVFCFILFAIIPTVFLFMISAFYIRSSFDKWFNLKVGGTLQKSIDVVKNYYQNTESNARKFAKNIVQKLGPIPSSSRNLKAQLDDLRVEYGLDAVEYYRDLFQPRILSALSSRENFIPAASLQTLDLFFSGKGDCRILNVGHGELVRCGVLLPNQAGVIFANYFIPMGLAAQLSEISLTYDDYKRDNPLNYPIKSTYFAILSMVTLLILFSAIWTGFYVAKRLTVPIEELSKATHSVAHGNLNYVIPKLSGGDEMHRLIESFNRMISDLRQNKKDIELNHSHLKKMNEELEHRRKYTEVLLESVQSGVVSFDEQGRVTVLNPAAKKLLELEDVDLFYLGKNFNCLFTPETAAEFQEIFKEVQGTATPIRKELRLTSSKNGPRHLLITLSVLRDEWRRALGVVAVFDDVTDIQKIERMLAWKEVARRMAHEIKNPLTPIQLSVQRLRRRYLEKIQDDGTFGEATEIILNEVGALKNLVSEFSHYSRLPEIKTAPDDLKSIIDEAVSLFRSGHEEIKFISEVESSIPLLELDRNQMKRVLINLFDNAVAAMGGVGRIWITAQKLNDKYVQLQVKDEGSGIPKEVENQLFEPYFSTKEGGTGLGLAIVQRIIVDHGARVRVQANQPKGTCFSFEFPITIAAAEIEKNLGSKNILESREWS